jgi:hypothetical protein
VAIIAEATQMSREAPTDSTCLRMAVGVMKIPEPIMLPIM